MTKHYAVINDDDADPTDLNLENGPEYKPMTTPVLSSGGPGGLKVMRQAAILKQITGRDAYGKPTTTSTNIICSFIPESGIKRTKEGDEIRYNARVALTQAAKPGDFINLQDANLSSLTQFYNKDVPILDYVHAVMHWGTVKWYEVLL